MRTNYLIKIYSRENIFWEKIYSKEMEEILMLYNRIRYDCNGLDQNELVYLKKRVENWLQNNTKGRA